MLRLQCVIFWKGDKEHLKILDSTIKNGEISLYCRFNKIIKGPGTSLQSNDCHTESYLTKFHFGSTEDSKEMSKIVTSIM